MTLILDTNVISELSRARPFPGVLSLIENTPWDGLWLSVLTLGEIRRGAAMQRAKNPAASDDIMAWLETTERRFAGRVLPITAEIAHRWGEITSDRTRPVVDTLIAATALVHGLTVVTRNMRDYRALDVSILNPWD